MDFLELAKNRYSVRKFRKEHLKEEDIKLIIEAGYVAPTACNLQPQVIYIYNTDEEMDIVRKCTSSHFFAPSAMLVCYDKTKCWKREFDGKTSGEIDASIVATHMMLEAHNIGVGSTWVMYFIPEAIRLELNIPNNIEPIALLMMGYPADDAQPYPGHHKFRPLEEIVIKQK